MDVYAWILADLLECTPPTHELEDDNAWVKVALPSSIFRSYEPFQNYVKNTLWEITSDSLAAWLANKISRRLLLLKFLPTHLKGLKFKQLTEKELLQCYQAGLVDDVFPKIVKQYSLSVYLSDAEVPTDLYEYLELKQDI